MLGWEVPIRHIMRQIHKMKNQSANHQHFALNWIICAIVRGDLGSFCGVYAQSSEVLVLGEGQYSASVSYHERNAMEHPLRNCVT